MIDRVDVPRSDDSGVAKRKTKHLAHGRPGERADGAPFVVW